MKNLELLILVILAFWVSISYGIAHIGGWFKLARFYRFSGTFLGDRWRFQSAQMRWKIGYNNCLTVGANPEGLYLSVMFILRFGHPPLFVPWGDISVSVIKGFFYPALEFRFQQVPVIPLRVSERLGQKIKESARTSWPGRDSESLSVGFEIKSG